uniref:Uncharacterized protein n=1 Tax=Arundo donax TaxID=35708 RepID=A0A0A9EF18_ARUDO
MPSPSPSPALAPPVLPISEHEDEIVAAVDANPVVVVIGETGSGKSTQLSQISTAAATPAAEPSLSPRPAASPPYPSPGSHRSSVSHLGM